MKFALYALLILILVTPSFGQESDSEDEGIRIDGNHSTLGFTIPIVSGISMVTGKFTDFSVDLVCDDEDPSKSSVALEIQVASISTGLSGRDGDITGERILNEASFPIITFQSSNIKRNGTDYIAIGDFTMHGVTKEIFLPVRVVTFVDEENPDDPWRAYHIGYKLDRRDYDINWVRGSLDFFVGYDIDVDIALLER
jgi:polyisoprenoid-binding protein YceI